MFLASSGCRSTPLTSRRRSGGDNVTCSSSSSGRSRHLVRLVAASTTSSTGGATTKKKGKGKGKGKKAAQHPQQQHDADPTAASIELPGLQLALMETLGVEEGPLAGGRGNQHRALVLDAAYRPINVINWTKAIKMDMAGRADVLMYYADGAVQTSRAALPMPAVVRARRLLDLSTILLGKAPLTRRNVMLRDKFCCQYCGDKASARALAEMTLDHVVPVSKGGGNSWGNLVTACRPCNQRKGNLTLKQLGWRLRCSPREPNTQELKIIVRGLTPHEVDNPPPEWADYLVPYRDKMLSRVRDHQ